MFMRNLFICRVCLSVTESFKILIMKFHLILGMAEFKSRNRNDRFDFGCTKTGRQIKIKSLGRQNCLC